MDVWGRGLIPSRLGRTGILAGISVTPAIPWSGTAGFLARTAGSLDALAVGFVVVQSALSDADVGLMFAWGLFGYLVFEYVTEVYPDAAHDAVDSIRFRGLTACMALYFGIFVFGAALAPGTIPALPSVVPSGGGGASLTVTVYAYLSGLVLASVAFGVHLHRSGRIGELGAVMYDVVDGRHVDERSGSGDQPPKRDVIVLGIGLPVVVCAFLGVGGVFLGLFYPLPEFALLGGMVLVHVVPDRTLGDRLPGRGAFEVDSRLLDSVTAAFENRKGSYMILFCLAGMSFSGMTLAIVFDHLAGTWSAFGPAGGLAPLESGLLVVTVASFGGYALLYWIRQLERVHPYSVYWEARYSDARVDGETDATADTDVVRPPGLLLPTVLPFLLVVAVAAVGRGIPGWQSRLLFLLGAVGLNLGMITVFHRSLSGRAQSVAGESRSLLVAVLGQLWLFQSLLFVDAGTPLPSLASRWPTFALPAVTMITLYYYPDWAVRARQRWSEPIGELLAPVPLVLVACLVVPLTAVLHGRVPPVLYGVVAVLGAAIVLDAVVDAAAAG